MNTFSAVIMSVLMFVTQSFNSQGAAQTGWHLIGRPKVTPTITITVKPSVSPTLVVFQPSATPTTVLMPENTSIPVQPTVTNTRVPKIDSVSPSSASFGQIITLKGTGFGTYPYFVNFKWEGNSQVAIYDAGGPIVSWSDTEIQVKIPAISGANQKIGVEVTMPNNVVSNREYFTLSEGQPIINEVPSNSAPGRDISLMGMGFGSEKGEVRIYNPADLSNPVGTCTVGFYLPTQSPTWWNDHIKCSIPNLPQKAEGYAFEVVTSKGTKSSVKFIHICDVEGCG